MPARPEGAHAEIDPVRRQPPIRYGSWPSHGAICLWRRKRGCDDRLAIDRRCGRLRIWALRPYLSHGPAGYALRPPARGPDRSGAHLCMGMVFCAAGTAVLPLCPAGRSRARRVERALRDRGRDFRGSISAGRTQHGRRNSTGCRPATDAACGGRAPDQEQLRSGGLDAGVPEATARRPVLAGAPFRCGDQGSHFLPMPIRAWPSTRRDPARSM